MEKEKKTKIIFWISFIVIALIIIGYYVFNYTNLPKVIKEKITGVPATPNTSGGQPSLYNAAGSFIGDYGDEINTDLVLNFGDKSNNVVRMQSAINEMIDKYAYPISKLSNDGVFGSKTASALQYISSNVLSSGNVTVNKIYNLKRVGIATQPIGSVTPYVSPTEQVPTGAYTGGSSRQSMGIDLPSYLFSANV